MSSKGGQPSKGRPRRVESLEDELARHYIPPKRETTFAGPSRRAAEPIVIDDDSEEEEEDWEEANGRKKEKDARAGRRGLSVERKQHQNGGMDQFEAREAVRAALSKLDEEIWDVQAQIEPLEALLVSLQADRKQLESQLSSLHSLSHTKTTTTTTSSSKAKSNGHHDMIDYQSSSFPWSPSLLPLARNTFDIPSFRLCQEGVINAAIDARDIVCVMPTGGGKSLTYQLPAVLGKKGLTVVISPLLALIWDQVRAMNDIGVEAVMLTGSTSTTEQNEIYRRLQEGGQNGEKEIRLCYLTPEKISKSKRLLSVLEKVNASGRLRRFVIVSSDMARPAETIDFRPDYKKLSVLKTLFPRVPIQAVTATLSTKTLPDLLKILRLGPICDGQKAKSTGTVFFTAPLYRPNLHYKVLTKPSSSKAAIETIGAWILENHCDDSGIIYCLSKKDTETVAESLRQWSKGRIKTGVYHAGIDDNGKESIHVDWRKGKINCICATIAFGLGIDKGDVRYVIRELVSNGCTLVYLHSGEDADQSDHSMSKSLDGYYQETGRAGRDGKDSDCVLFYRGQDSSRLASFVCQDVEGIGKLQEMTRFAQELKTCRKVAFAKYFSTTANLSANAWDNAATLVTDSAGGSLTTCGICDNCTRDEASVVVKDITVDAWKVLRVLEEVKKEGGRVTISNLGDLVRGLGGGAFDVVGGRKRKAVDRASICLSGVIGSKVDLSKDDTERLLIHLILTGYLQESYTPTAFSTNVYLNPGSRSVRLSRLTEDQVRNTASLNLECAFLAPGQRAKSGKKRSRKEVVAVESGESGEDEEDDDDVSASKRKMSVKAKVKKQQPAAAALSEPEDWDPEQEMADYEEADWDSLCDN